MKLEVIISKLENERLLHVEEIKRIDNELGVLRKYLPEVIKEDLVLTKDESRNITFKQAILSFFDDGVPKTARELLHKYSRLRGEGYKYSSFSPQLSGTKEIRKQEFPGNRQSTRYYYGKAEWFVNDQLKPEFQKKIDPYVSLS